MFAPLTRHLHAVSKTDESIVSPLVNEFEAAEYKRQQMVDDFKQKCIYNGNNLTEFSLSVLSLFAREKEISQGAFFISDILDGKSVIRFLTGFASPSQNNTPDILEMGEGFPGQVAKDGKMINISDIPHGYLVIESGLGKAAPASLIIFPVKYHGIVLAVIELASFHRFTQDDELFFDEVSASIAEQIHKLVTRSGLSEEINVEE